MKSKESPLEIWKCCIKLHKRHRKNHEEEEKDGIMNDVEHFAETTDPKLVDDLVRRAQKALLNPSIEAKKFAPLGGSADLLVKRDELMFTGDSVIIDISGSKIDLSLIDLPGIIKSVQSHEDQQLIPLIESVITDYISQPKTLILAVFTCKDDMENQAIFRMAREVDPTGERTIGVLTKPDTIEKGTYDRWIKILSGDLYYLKLGYFLVKMPSKKELEVLKEKEALKGDHDAYLVEDAFFKSCPVWVGLQSRLPDRFGIECLRNELGSLLNALIESCLPLMKQAAQDSLLEV
jgi:hypothetical protein